MTRTNCVLDRSDKNCPILTEIDVVVIQKTAKGACIKYTHANKKDYSSIVDAAVQHVILQNQIKENIVIISNWKGTFIKCKTCKRILTGKKGWFGKK